MRTYTSNQLYICCIQTCVYIYIYTHVYTYIHTYIYIYILHITILHITKSRHKVQSLYKYYYMFSDLESSIFQKRHPFTNTPKKKRNGVAEPTFRDVPQLAAHQRQHDPLLGRAAVQQVPWRAAGAVDRRQDPTAQSPARLVQRHRLGEE